MRASEEIAEQLRRQGFIETTVLRRKEMLGFWGWVITLGHLVASAFLYVLFTSAFCGMLLLSATTEAQVDSVMGYWWFMMKYVGPVVLLAGNAIYWKIQWNSYD